MRKVEECPLAKTQIRRIAAGQTTNRPTQTGGKTSTSGGILTGERVVQYHPERIIKPAFDSLKHVKKSRCGMSWFSARCESYTKPKSIPITINYYPLKVLAVKQTKLQTNRRKTQKNSYTTNRKKQKTTDVQKQKKT